MTLDHTALDASILLLPLVTGLLVLATHVPLGMKVLERGIVFIDLAIAQIAGLGVIAADEMGLGEGGLAVQAAAVGAALLGALLLTWTERRAVCCSCSRLVWASCCWRAIRMAASI
jgi:zinc/manganese transport system permease protein